MGIRFFKSLDAYGHPIKLNFENNGTTYQTIVGSSFTILWILISVILFGGAMGGGDSEIVARYVNSNRFIQAENVNLVLVLSGRNITGDLEDISTHLNYVGAIQKSPCPAPISGEGVDYNLPTNFSV